METKKNSKADLEKHRTIFLQVGLIITLAVIFAAFEYQSKNPLDENISGLTTLVYEEEMIPITKRDEPKVEEIKQKIVEVIKIVENTANIKDEYKVDDTESKEDIKIKDVVPYVEPEVDELIDFYVIEDKPEFPGGEAELLKWVAQNTHYPQLAKDMGIDGKVFVKFIIDKEGNVTNTEIIRGVDPSLDKEALRVVNSMPKWKPGKQRGKAVNVSFQLPIKFVLASK